MLGASLRVRPAARDHRTREPGRPLRVDFVTCDVFTERPFAGNQLLVVPHACGLTEVQMQAIAREINYSESTFVLPPDDPRHAYRQRTFVPLKEIPYAGHPTVGTAFVMSWLGKLPDDALAITVEVGFGSLRLDLVRGGGSGVSRVRMEQGPPAWDPPVTGRDALERLAASTGVSLDALSRTLPVQCVTTGNRSLIVPLTDVAALEAASPDARLLLTVEREHDALIIYLVAPSGAGEERVRARAFCTGAGVPEDPATGSAAGPLGIYLGLHGAIPGGGSSFVIDQGIEMGRPSEISVEVALDRSRPTGVLVSGSAVRMMTGSLEV